MNALSASRHCRIAGRVAVLLALVHACWAAPCFSQVPPRNQLYEPVRRPPGIRYEVLKSAHFHVIFQQGAEQEAREAAALLEQELPGAEALTGHARPMAMPVVLNAFNDRSNGFVNTLPFRQEIETAGIAAHRLSARYTSWMQAVAPHELVHATQAHSHAGFGIGSLLRHLSPDLARSLNLGLPPGLSEGAAVFHESRIQPGAGRLNFSLFQMQFRAAMASENPWTLAQILEIPAYAYPANRYYSGGANFFAHLARGDGGEFFRDTKAFHYRWPFFGTGVELWQATGKKPVRLGREFRLAMAEQEAAHRAASGPWTSRHVVATGPGRSHRRPQWINDSTVVVHVTGYDVRTGFYAVSMRAGMRAPIAYESVTGNATFSVSDNGHALLFSRYVRDRHVDSKWVADVFSLDLASGISRRITRGQRVFFPVQWGGDTLAIQNQGQFTGWVRIGGHGSVARMAGPVRATMVQIAPSPDGTMAAVVLRQGGRQGIYRAFRADSDAPVLEPWIVFEDASVYDICWHGQGLFFSADPGGTVNVFAVLGEQVVQVTKVAYGAMEPCLSPDGKTLAYVEYRHERYDLMRIPWDSGAARPVPAALLRTTAASEVPPSLALHGAAVMPYRAGRYLLPRTLLPDWSDSGNGSAWSGALGLGPGLTVQGADPLRRWAYSLGGYYQAERAWYFVRVATHVQRVHADLKAYRELGTARLLSQRGTSVLTVGQENRGARLRLSLPVYAKSNVHSTTMLFALEGTLAANRLFALPGDFPLQLAQSWRSLKKKLTLSPTYYLRFNMARNARDLLPNTGTALHVSADLDLWDERGAPRRAAVVRAARFLSLSLRAHTGVRLRATLVAQSSPRTYNLDTIAPRGYEQAPFGARTYTGLDAFIVQPLWFIENGFVLVPVYFKVLYAYGFADLFYGVQSGTYYRSVGAGLGIQLRVFHYLDLQFRLGPAYLVDAARFHWAIW